ncbi:hypothetical protein [Lysinibacillus endophyticus]|uniref:LysM domain-containing protein n=1 Tax=Ureibacillus endophyticus TaxID=1978490 RepID=A0A494Z910_9BACL|nr:hypothetical protein [Lysinibacillus endophyticus]MCP1145279.1 hypothetical protein [Lysinibacillus endophyticus]RKQ19113.1 hypothetical protein D8M03_03420 [Lysinibacillus endophyticus]
MRFLIFTVVFFLVAAVIKIDLTEGTVPLAAFDDSQDLICNEQISVQSISVLTTEGESVQSLFAAYPSEVKISLPERMAHFYKLNPHLKKQAMVPGELVKVPIYHQRVQECSR